MNIFIVLLSLLLLFVGTGSLSVKLKNGLQGHCSNTLVDY